MSFDVVTAEGGTDTVPCPSLFFDRCQPRHVDAWAERLANVRDIFEQDFAPVRNKVADVDGELHQNSVRWLQVADELAQETDSLDLLTMSAAEARGRVDAIRTIIKAGSILHDRIGVVGETDLSSGSLRTTVTTKTGPDAPGTGLALALIFSGLAAMGFGVIFTGD